MTFAKAETRAYLVLKMPPDPRLPKTDGHCERFARSNLSFVA